MSSNFIFIGILRAVYTIKKLQRPQRVEPSRNKGRHTHTHTRSPHMHMYVRVPTSFYFVSYFYLTLPFFLLFALFRNWNFMYLITLFFSCAVKLLKCHYVILMNSDFAGFARISDEAFHTCVQAPNHVVCLKT